MAAKLQIEYSPEGIATVKEERFGFGKPQPESTIGWAIDLAHNVAQKLLIEETRKQHVVTTTTAHRFAQLVEQWRNETGHYSITFKRAMHPAYQQIIGMGEKALPFIFNELSRRPSGQWFWALNAITGEEPTLNQPDIDRAIKAWLEWATQHDYLA